MALPAGFVEFIVLSGRPVEAVAGLAQRRPLEAWLSLVLNRHRLVWVCAAGNRRNLDLGNLAHGAACCFPDLAEGVQVLEFDRYLLDLSRLAVRGEGRTAEQLAQRLPLFRARTGIDVVSNEGLLDRLAYYLAKRTRRRVQSSRRPTSRHRIGRCQFGTARRIGIAHDEAVHR